MHQVISITDQAAIYSQCNHPDSSAWHKVQGKRELEMLQSHVYKRFGS